MTYALPQDHPKLPGPKTGVLIVNLGTPDATDYWSMRRYLKEFLSDRRVIDTPRLLWWPILNGIILSTRPGRSGKAYAEIWDQETNESPLRRITREQTEMLTERLADLSDDIDVDWAMRYGQPSIADKIQAMTDRGCTRIAVMALYPQYSATTTATVYDTVFKKLQKMRWQPAIRTLQPYHDDAVYVDAVARSIETHLAGLDWEPEVVLASFHGLPKRYFMSGDPYHCHCFKSARMVRERLGWPEEKMKVAFQSRFGPEEWLKPYMDETIRELAQKGVKRVSVVCPGFAADCVETLEEIAIGIREEFEEAGGTHFSMIPCLNQSEPGIDLLEALARRELLGWIDTTKKASVHPATPTMIEAAQDAAD